MNGKMWRLNFVVLIAFAIIACPLNVFAQDAEDAAQDEPPLYEVQLDPSNVLNASLSNKSITSAD